MMFGTGNKQEWSLLNCLVCYKTQFFLPKDLFVIELNLCLSQQNNWSLFLTIMH